jgi:hypothetical protein
MSAAMKSSVPGRELGALGRGDVPAAVATLPGPVRRREADGRWRPAPPDSGGRERPSPTRSRSRARESRAAII